MKKNNLITIGELSKLTGVNAKSLRYYEKIGVLTPSYINPENDYRYYNYSQIQFVSSIQFYVEMDIPLSELQQFMNKKNGTINFREQVSYGIEVAKRKQEEIAKKIKNAELLRKKMDFSDKVRFANEIISCEMPEKSYAVVSVTGNPTAQQYYTTVFHLLNAMKKIGIQDGSDCGMLCLGMPKAYYVYIEILSNISEIPTSLKYFTIPSQTFLCRRVPSIEFCEQTSFESLIPQNVQSDVIILSEMFASDYNYRQPDFELRWSKDKSIS